MNGAALLVGYCTGMVATRRTAPAGRGGKRWRCSCR